MTLQAIIILAAQGSIFLMVLGFGMQATLDDALYLFRNPRLLIRAVLAMFVIMPLFALLIVALFALDQVVEIALVALAVSPIPPVFPAKAFKKGGNKAYTLGLLTAMSLLSIIVIPMAIEIFERVSNRSAKFEFAKVATPILTGIIVPLVLGIIIHRFAPAFAERIGGTISKIGMIFLILAVLPILIVLLPSVWLLVGNGTILVFAAFAVVGITVGYFLGGPDAENRALLAISTASRHPGLALAITAAVAPDPKLAPAAIILYLLVSAIAAGITLGWITGKSKKETKADMSDVKQV
jgi:BASS family bile acid:Na+ symporter